MAQMLAQTSTSIRPALQTRRPFADVSSARSCKRTVSCAIQRPDAEIALPRRQLLATGGALLAAPLLWASPAAAADSFLEVETLSGFQRADQRNQFQARVLDELKAVLTSDDAPDAVRALINDAGTYDLTTGTGGFNGSLRLELERPENASLKGYFAKLAAAKAAIDEKSATIAGGIGPISYADLEVLGAKVATKKLWRKIKINKAKVKSGGENIDEAFGAQWDTVVGRVDADSPDPEGRIPAPGASTAELKDFFFKLGNKNLAGGFGTPKAPFWARPASVLLGAAYPEAEEKLASEDEEFAYWKAKYDRSKKSATRTDFEVDYIEYLDKLGKLGAKFDRNAYLVPLKIPTRKL